MESTPKERAPVSGSRRLRRHRLGITVALGVAVAMVVGGLAASRFVKSPSQIAAETRPPTPSVLSAPVVSMVVHNSLVLRGVITNPAEFTATPSSAYGAANQSSTSGASSLIVTKSPVAPGSVLSLGEVVVEVSGRPLFVMQGATPSYRDLGPGDTGNDVAGLQASLRQLGIGTASDSSGVYGEGTKAAVGRLYTMLGYAIPQAGDPQALVTAKATVVQDQRNLAGLVAGASATPSSIAGSGVPSGPTPIGGAPLATQIQWAKDDLATAQAKYAALLNASGPMVPQGEILFIPSFPAQLVKLGAGVGSSPTTPLITVSVGSPGVQGQLNPAQAPLVRTGMKAMLADGLTGYQTTAAVTAVAASITTPADASTSPYVAVTLEPANPPPLSELGANLQVTIDAAQSMGAVLAVPEAAVFAAADGQTYVSRLNGGGASTRVAVQAGLSGGGMVQVTPATPGTLEAGDSVVIGINNTNGSPAAGNGGAGNGGAGNSGGAAHG